MKSHWLLATLLSAVPLYAWQGTTPQAALEELATATKPEAIARHLPEPVQKRIEVLPKVQKQLVLDQLLEMKKTQLGGCSVRPAQDSEGWEILDGDGNSKGKGKVRLANAFISGVEALLPLKLEFPDNTQEFIVTMHLEGDEWRIDDFGPWEKNDLGLAKLLHEPTEMEKNETTATETINTMVVALNRYASRFHSMGFPFHLRILTTPMESENAYARTRATISSSRNSLCAPYWSRLRHRVSWETKVTILSPLGAWKCEPSQHLPLYFLFRPSPGRKRRKTAVQTSHFAASAPFLQQWLGPAAPEERSCGPLTAARPGRH